MAEWTPTPEMVEVGVQAVREATMRTTVMYQTHHSERAREVRAALIAAYPLIAAQVLHDAASLRMHDQSATTKGDDDE